MNSYNNNLQKLPFSILDDYNNNKRLGLKNNFSLGSEILCAKFDKDDSLIAAGCLDGTLQIYHLQTGLLKNKFQTNQPGQSSNPVTCLRWRPSQINGIVKNLITTGDVNGNIVQWHASSGKELERIIEPENQILCLDYDKNGNYLATAGKDCIENGAYLFSAQFSKNNNDSILVGGSGKNEAKLFESQDNFETLGSVSNFNKGIFTVDYANTSNKFLLGGGDGYLVVVSQVLK
ncbi:WD repeat protein [Ichthyophthirius multifiliis]|uniref:WD repeat protein n=1 Tax=Ichthyophthirius multifiliis TaxID=5932 RepID=G0R286_ICHMU|nr:WD repeat protein [Ichthyophthirius multifiliis]EGR28411.1 WD repeat protein [Ichthyophthirius multifiliis]|eukprot:XP_004029647.1 WD repeat protein [Ichthyophthirius multifiliis]